VALKDRLLETSLAYRLWQGPFAERKLAPVLAANDLRTLRRVLDVGCGPGTNATHFEHTDYLGLDLNPRYIESARRSFRGRFEVADATTYAGEPTDRFDFILVNSLLHHLDDQGAARVLSSLAGRLAPGGHVHVLDLILPDRAGLARTLARWDRGHHARPLERWRTLFGAHFDEVLLEPYALTALSVPLWNMVYFKGRARGGASGSPSGSSSPPT
jgi:SAM-dependent methyltransferase